MQTQMWRHTHKVDELSEASSWMFDAGVNIAATSNAILQILNFVLTLIKCF